MRLVVKIGGASNVAVDRVLDDVASQVRADHDVLVVHGGSETANELGIALGHPPRKLLSKNGVESRYSDARSMEILTLALVGSVKPQLVEGLLSRGVRAMGLSGADGNTVLARRKTAITAQIDGRLRVVRDDCSGQIKKVNRGFLETILSQGVTPVLSPPAWDPDFGLVNVDADRMAAAVASTIGADRLIFVSNVPGFLRDASDPQSVIRVLTYDEIDWAMDLAKGRMKQKILSVKQALMGDVEVVHIADGSAALPVTAALAGEGSRFEKTQSLSEVRAQ